MAEYMETEYIKKPILKIAIKSHFKKLKYRGKYAISVMDANADINRIISEIPAADVVEIKHGKWYRHDKKTHGDTCYHCSQCEKMPLTDCGMVWELTPYCPFCGAKMDGEHNER